MQNDDKYIWRRRCGGTAVEADGWAFVMVPVRITAILFGQSCPKHAQVSVCHRGTTRQKKIPSNNNKKQP
jgi:hypothetical protein